LLYTRLAVISPDSYTQPDPRATHPSAPPPFLFPQQRAASHVANRFAIPQHGDGPSRVPLGAFGGVVSLGVIDAMAAVGGIYIGGPR
jgi:hypothetical protein